MKSFVSLAVFVTFYVSGLYLAITHSPIFDPALGGVRSAAGIYPSHLLTPGKADTLSVADLTKSYTGQTYSQSHRAVSDTEKKRVYAEYNVSYPQAAGAYEVDHFYPLCAGGSNDLANLWLEPSHVQSGSEDLGFHSKDLLEAEICRRVKDGSVDPEEAFKRMTTDWVSYYHEIIPAGRLGGIAEDMDGDTE